MSCTAAVDSYAATISEVVGEVELLISERGAQLTTNVLRLLWKKKKTTRMG
jgi:sulfate adenylyltransferase subunit 2